MYLSLEQTLALEELNFTLDNPLDEVDQNDAYWFEGQIFIIGGLAVPCRYATVLTEEKIYTTGLRLISFDDLIDWLEKKTLYTIEGTIQGVILAVTHIEEEEYYYALQGKTLQEAAYHMVAHLLEEFPTLAAPQPVPTIKR